MGNLYQRQDTRLELSIPARLSRILRGERINPRNPLNPRDPSKSESNVRERDF